MAIANRLVSAVQALVRILYWTLKRPRYIVLMGGPGAGKGTLATRISTALKLEHLSMGDLLRREKSSGSPLGKEVAGYVDTGQLVPDELAMRLLDSELSKWRYRNGAIFDGFPRRISQAKLLDEFLTRLRTEISQVIYLDISQEDLIERLAFRRTCSNPECGRSYHLKFEPPKEPGRCDECHSQLYQRPDDNADVIADRLAVFQQQTLPLLDYYGKVVLTFNSTNQSTSLSVFNAVMAALKAT